MSDAAEAAGGSWSAASQFGIQAAAVGITIAYAAVVSLVLVVLVEKTVGFRTEADQEMSGLDHSVHGEHGYGMLNPT